MTTRTLPALAFAASLAAATLPVSAETPSPAATAQPDRVIVVSAATRRINVAGGSTVRFVVGDRTFDRHFDTGGAFVEAVDLANIVPPGLLDHRVTVYVAGDPMYR